MHHMNWRGVYRGLILGLLLSGMTMWGLIRYDHPLTQSIAGMGLSWGLVPLFVTDCQDQVLPDHWTMPLLWTGLAINAFGVFTTPQAAILGAITGYLSLWMIAQIYFVLRGQPGLGRGDFKLLAVFGAWLGWQALPSIVLLASTMGSFVGLGLVLLKRMRFHQPLPFGPFLIVGGLIVLFYS